MVSRSMVPSGQDLNQVFVSSSTVNNDVSGAGDSQVPQLLMTVMRSENNHGPIRDHVCNALAFVWN